MSVPVEPLYKVKKHHAQFFAVLGIIGFFVSLFILLRGGTCWDNSSHKFYSGIAVSLWTALPPCWFFYEYFYYFPKHGNPEAGFESLKGAQEVTSKVWAAAAVVLGALYLQIFPGAQ